MTTESAGTGVVLFVLLSVVLITAMARVFHSGAIAVINTTDSNTNSTTPVPADSVVTDILAAPEANSATALQNPIFLLMGQ